MSALEPALLCGSAVAMAVWGICRAGFGWRYRLPTPVRSWLERLLEAAGDDVKSGVGPLLLRQGVGLLSGVVIAIAGCYCGVSLLFSAPMVLAFSSLPLVTLARRARHRRDALLRALPACLDLLTLAIEAGLDFVPALARVAERGRTGPLRDELSTLLQQLRLGLTREDALKGMAERLNLPAFDRWASAMVQANRSGVGLARVLRLQAQRLRVEEAHHAEAAALRAPVKLLFPLLLFIFPGTFLVLLGPLAFELVAH